MLITPMEKRFLERKERGENISRWIGKEPFIMREEGSGTRKEAEKILSSRGINLSEFNVAAVVENPETVKRSVENGVGISILSQLTAEEEAMAGKLLVFPLEEMGGRRAINLVYDAGYPHLPAADKFIQEVKKLYL